MVKECIKKCSNCGHNGHNSRSCANKKNKEICVKIFGFKIHVSEKIEPSISSSSSSMMMRKSKSTPNLIASNNRANSHDDDGYLSDHGPGVREKKKGVPWTEDEHLSFLNGLEKLGKGDWKGISRNFVQSRTATQVASHAQKYFKRMSSTDKRNRRSSLFDMSLNEPEVKNTPPPEPPDTTSVEIPKLADKLPIFNVNQNDGTEEQANMFAKADATPLTATSALPYTSCYGVPSFSQMPYFPMMGMTNNGQIYPGDKSISATMPSVPMMYIPNPAYFYLPKSPDSQAQVTLFMPTYSHGSSSPMARP